MKLKEMVIDPIHASQVTVMPDEKVAVCVPSAWIDVSVYAWPGRQNRYRVWQRILAEHAPKGPFNFDQAYDFSEKKTLVSVMQFANDKWAWIPIPLAQVALLTAPKVRAKQWLPRRRAPFTLLAYRWQDEVELCAYRQGILLYGDQGADIAALYSRVIQKTPVLAAAPLYCEDATLTKLFLAHHAVCRTW